MRDEGKSFFEGIETLRQSKYSHYLITNDSFLELRALEEIAMVLVSLNDSLDRLHWGELYPLYRFYLSVRHTLKKVRRKLKLFRTHQNARLFIPSNN